MRPILLLDVDGVLNPVPFTTTWSSDWEFLPEFISSEESGMWPLNVSAEMAMAITDLGCDVRWLTTWGDHAHDNIGAAFGWRLLPVVAQPDRRSFSWKVKAATEILSEPGPPVVWIDDDIAEFACRTDFTTIDPHKRLITVCPKTNVGLTRSHISYIAERLQAHGGVGHERVLHGNQ